MTIKIDRLNPAEYFAALGILELAGGTSYFDSAEDTTATLVINGNTPVPDPKILPLISVQHEKAGIAPVIVGNLTLAWWLDVWRRDKSELKLWAGQAQPFAMLNNYQKFMPNIPPPVSEWLSYYIKTVADKSCFGLDTRAPRQSMGYSLNDADEPCPVYPYTEFLCAIGLQDFRPRGNRYFTWGRAIPLSIARAAARMEVPGLQQRQYGFSVRGTQWKEIDTVAEVFPSRQ